MKEMGSIQPLNMKALKLNTELLEACNMNPKKRSIANVN